MTQNSTRYVRDEKPLYSADSMASMALRQKCVNEGDESNLASHILSQMYWIAYHTVTFPPGIHLHMASLCYCISLP